MPHGAGVLALSRKSRSYCLAGGNVSATWARAVCQNVVISISSNDVRHDASSAEFPFVLRNILPWYRSRRENSLCLHGKKGEGEREMFFTTSRCFRVHRQYFLSHSWDESFRPSPAWASSRSLLVSARPIWKPSDELCYFTIDPRSLDRRSEQEIGGYNTFLLWSESKYMRGRLDKIPHFFG